MYMRYTHGQNEENFLFSSIGTYQASSTVYAKDMAMSQRSYFSSNA